LQRKFAGGRRDGGVIEDITLTGTTMRNIRNAPLFLRLGARMRGPKDIPVGSLKRVLISNVTCYAPSNEMPSILSGIPDHPIEDVKITECFFLHKGGGTAETAALQPVERPTEYPEPARFGPLPAQHFYVRHARNVEFNGVELATLTADARPAFWFGDVNDADLFRVKLPPSRAAAVMLNDVSGFRAIGNRDLRDISVDQAVSRLQL
jgi:polygalacturonase